jgi:hypothetical protein
VGRKRRHRAVGTDRASHRYHPPIKRAQKEVDPLRWALCGRRLLRCPSRSKARSCSAQAGRKSRPPTQTQPAVTRESPRNCQRRPSKTAAAFEPFFTTREVGKGHRPQSQPSLWTGAPIGRHRTDPKGDECWNRGGDLCPAGARRYQPRTAAGGRRHAGGNGPASWDQSGSRIW